MTQDLADASSDGPRRREPLRVLLVDDVADLRLLLASLFGAYPGVEVIAEAENGERAVELAVAHKPDLIVLDLAMPVLDGVGALPRLREASPASRIVVLTAIPRERDPGALAQGAAAYVEKSVATDRLVPDVLAGAGLLDTALTALSASRRVESEFPARTRSVASARAFAQRALDGWREGDLGDVVSLLLSELVTNAVVHAASAPNVAIHLLPDRVHVEVADDDSSQIRPQAVPADAEGGRGLTLVEALAHRWGQVTLPGGKVVWFEVLRSL